MKEHSSLSTDERRILEVLAESDSGRECREVADQSGISVTETYRILRALHNKKLVTKSTHENDSGLPVLLHSVSQAGQQRLLPASKQQAADGPTDDGPYQPLGPHTDAIIQAFESRDWTFLDCPDPNTAFFTYRGSFGWAAFENKAYAPGDVGLITLDCLVIRDGTSFVAKVATCGVIQGCPDYRSKTVGFTFDGPELSGQLDEHETHARDIDTAALAQCLLFGACSEAVPLG